MAYRRHIIGLALAGATLVGTACSSDSKSSDSTSRESDTADSASTPGTSGDEGDENTDGFSVANSLRQIPSIVLESDDASDDSDVQIAVSDLDAASELAGVDHPDDGTTDVDEITEWLLAINGPSRDDKRPLTAAILPEVSHAEDFANVAEFDEEVGWSISDVHTFIEYQVPPNAFSVMTGGFSEDALTDAIGKPANDIWSLGGEDFSTDFGNQSSARPLGESLRFALHDDTLAVSRSTPPVEAWNALDTSKTAGTLAEDEELAAVAAALDDSGVYSAFLSQADFAEPQANVPPDAEAQTKAAGLGPFSTLGVGQTVEDGTPYAVFVYYYADETAAADAVDPLTTLLNDGVSNRTRTPWNELFAIRDISATGHILKATLRLTDFSPGSVWDIMFVRDNLVSGS